MSKRTLTRIKFFAIKRELQSTNRRQGDIAADYEISSTTVSLINRAGTWENYTAGVKAPKPLRQPVKPNDPIVRREKAAKAGLKPVTREQREEDKLAKKLDDARKRQEDWENSPVTRKEFDRHRTNNAIELLGKRDKNSLSSVTFAFLTIVALVLAVIALVK